MTEPKPDYKFVHSTREIIAPPPTAKNGKPETTPLLRDNRYQLDVDGRFIETWELMVMESGNFADAIMVFARYLVRGGKRVSPEIPNTPLDELSRAEVAQIENSSAYKVLKRFTIPQLNAAAQSFVEQSNNFNDPN